MDIHKPKPVHGWREFLGEVATIVLGVLIAIGAEQTVEAAHWSQKVETDLREIMGEVGKNATYYAFRRAAAECVVRRLDELNSVTESVARRSLVQPIAHIGPHIGELIGDNAWQAARAEQALTHFPRREFDGLSVLYAQQVDIKSWVVSEEEAWATLEMLEGDPNRLGPTDITLLRNALQQARNLEFLITLNAKVQLGRSEALGVKTPTVDPADLKAPCAPLERSLNPAPMGRP
jgi:hypothetical protein